MTPKTLQDELMQSIPFDSLETEAVLNIAYTSECLLRKATDFLKEHHLTHIQYNALRILRGAGENGLPCLELGKRLIWGIPDITRLVDNIEKSGYAKRVRCEKDRRVVYVHMTPKGLKLLSKLDAPMKNLNKELLGHLSEEELKKISFLMAKARHS